MTEFYCWWVLLYWLKQRIPALREVLLADLKERLGLLGAAKDLLIRSNDLQEIRAIINVLTPARIEIGPDVLAVRQALLVYLDEQIDLLGAVVAFANQSDSLREIGVVINFLRAEEESEMVLEEDAA